MRKHENCPELGENELLLKAAEIRLEYMIKLGELIKGFEYSECRALYELTDLAKGNNCGANMYHAIPDLRDLLVEMMQWHKFNRHVHGIELK